MNRTKIHILVDVHQQWIDRTKLGDGSLNMLFRLYIAERIAQSDAHLRSCHEWRKTIVEIMAIKEINDVAATKTKGNA